MKKSSYYVVGQFPICHDKSVATNTLMRVDFGDLGIHSGTTERKGENEEKETVVITF